MTLSVQEQTHHISPQTISHSLRTLVEAMEEKKDVILESRSGKGRDSDIFKTQGPLLKSLNTSTKSFSIIRIKELSTRTDRSQGLYM